VKLQLEVKDDRRVAAQLQGMGDRARDARPAMKRVRDIMASGVVRAIESKGASIGAAWPELADATKERKKRQGLPAEPLVASGALLNSLRGGARRILRASRSSAVVGTRVAYARYHERGFTETAKQAKHLAKYFNDAGRVGRKGVPRRKLVGIAPHDRTKAVAIVQDYLVRGHV
jgi:phage gpG-like protein